LFAQEQTKAFHTYALLLDVSVPHLKQFSKAKSPHTEATGRIFQDKSFSSKFAQLNQK
jgi:hypothetical protein